jgi:hypothetical protein
MILIVTAFNVKMVNVSTLIFAVTVEPTVKTVKMRKSAQVD